ncbi:PD-(D/E)XK nuclease family transposase, partial [Parabacteroides sp.]
ECDTLFEKWLYTLKHMEKWDRMPDALKEQVFQRLAELAEVANLSEDNRVAYDKALDYYYIAETVRHDDYVMGMKKGMERGMEKGMEKGIEKVACQMLKAGLSIETISQYTGLSSAKIEGLA